MDHQVVVDELGRPGAVGEDPADRARDEEHVLRAVRLEPVVHRRLVAQIELMASRAENVREAVGVQPASDGGSNEASMPCDVHAGIARNLMRSHGASVSGGYGRRKDAGARLSDGVAEPRDARCVSIPKQLKVLRG